MKIPIDDEREPRPTGLPAMTEEELAIQALQEGIEQAIEVHQKWAEDEAHEQKRAEASRACDERVTADKKTNNKRWELFKRSGDGKPCKFCGKPSFYRLSEYGYYCRQCHSEESAEPEQKRVEETWTEKEGAIDSLDESVYGGKVFEGGPKDQETGEGRLLFTGETANVSFEASEAIKAANKDQKRSELEEGWNDQAQGNVSQEPKEREQCEWRAKGYPSCSCRICRPRIHYPNVTTGCCTNPKCNPDQETEEPQSEGRCGFCCFASKSMGALLAHDKICTSRPKETEECPPFPKIKLSHYWDNTQNVESVDATCLGCGQIILHQLDAPGHKESWSRPCRCDS